MKSSQPQGWLVLPLGLWWACAVWRMHCAGLSISGAGSCFSAYVVHLFLDILSLDTFFYCLLLGFMKAVDLYVNFDSNNFTDLPVVAVPRRRWTSCH